MSDPISFDALLTEHDPNALFFSGNDLGVSTNPLVNIARLFFYQEKITNQDYIERYYAYFKKNFPDASKEDFLNKASADRKFIRNKDKITFNMLNTVLTAMGFSLENIRLCLVEEADDQTRRRRLFVG